MTVRSASGIRPKRLGGLRVERRQLGGVGVEVRLVVGGVLRVGGGQRLGDPVRVLRRVRDVEPQVRVDRLARLVAREVVDARQVLAERDDRASVPASATRSASQSSRPSPLRTTRSASASRRTSEGVGSKVWTSPPLGTRLVTATCSPPTCADEVREHRGRGDDLHRVRVGGGRAAAARPAGGDDEREPQDQGGRESPGPRSASRPARAGRPQHRPNTSSRWAVTRNPDRRPIAARTSASPPSSTSSERPHPVQIAWWWWTASQAT